MGKTKLGEKREVLLRVELPDPHQDLTLKGFVTLSGPLAHMVKELEEVEQKPRATLWRELIEDGLKTRIVHLEGRAQEKSDG